MKVILLFDLVLLLTILLSGCNTNTSKIDSDKIVRLDKSLLKWNDIKDINGTSYQYSTSFLSWVGFGDETTKLL